MSKIKLTHGYFSSEEKMLSAEVLSGSESVYDPQKTLEMFAGSNLGDFQENPSELYEDLSDQKIKFLQDEALSRLFEGVALPVLIPRSHEDDPGLFFTDHFVPAIEWAHQAQLIESSVSYLSDVPMDYRLTPVPRTRHQDILDSLSESNLTGWFMPSLIGVEVNAAIDLVASMSANVSLVGFNDGWPIIMQHTGFFKALCRDAAFWFSGITSETSGVGFCLECDEEGRLVLDRRPYENMCANDVQGLLITVR